jgi:uncharacterized membrane protein YidH (DUF202 family)
MKNDDAAGGITTLFFAFLLAGTLFMVIGFGIDRMTLLSSRMFADAAATQMRFDIFQFQIAVMRVEPFILLIGIGINYWINQIRQMSGAVMLGTILMCAGEMIILTLVLMMFTLFGGMGIDTIVQFVNQWAFTPAEDMYFLIQYLGTIFYAFCFLLTIAVVAQFIILCFQTVDYAGTYNY